MSRAARRAGLNTVNKRMTKHSVRRTMCSQLYQCNIAPNMIAQVSGHKNLNALQKYTDANEDQ